MKKRLSLVLVAAIIFVLAAPGLRAQSTPYDKYLTSADIEKAVGMTGVKSVPREPRKGAGGHLNFANAKGDLILLASFLAATDFNSYKGTPGMVKSQVQGLGDEAFIGPANDLPYMLVVRKADKCLGLSTFADPQKPGTNRLTMDQLKAIAAVIIGRM
jgi:hypothetical protein